VALRRPPGPAAHFLATPILLGRPAPTILVHLAPTLSGAVDLGLGAGSLDLDGALQRLLRATGAAAAELFLTAPSGTDVVMAAQAGQDLRVFRERSR